MSIFVENDFEREQARINEATDFAFSPIGGKSSNNDYSYCFESFDDIRPKEILSSELIQKMIALAANICDSNNPFKLIDPKTIVDNLSLDGLDSGQQSELLEKFIPFNQFMEMDHLLTDKHHLRMCGESFKDKIRDLIEKRIISIDFSKIKDEKDFVSQHISRIIYDRQKLYTKIKDSDIYKALNSDIKTNLDVFNYGYKKFLNYDWPGPLPQRDLMRVKDVEVLKAFAFSDFNFGIRAKVAQQIRIVYIPSGGGKTTLSEHKQHGKRYYDVDKLCRDNNDLLKKFQQLADRFKKYKDSIMTVFFKYCYSKLDLDILTGSIILANHPNQIPNCFKRRTNELIIIPKSLNFRVRFF